MLADLFQAGNVLALLGWSALIIAPLLPRFRLRLQQAAGLVLPALLGLAYLVLVAAFWWRAEGGFGSLAEVRSLFDTPGMLVAGWFHYLAFDLFVGGWIVREGARSGIPHPILVPSLALTFLFGPAGFLLFLLTRSVLPRSAAPQAQGG
ncbi:ABA4-like family protein [Arenibaculum pallidiluteum]|uniref:ABA4-like family protein n=1 Tax=Arenibaculum pallidiluteum TaxID=2812559 RepID=UPI001A978F1A|nr:ABA4-like family protein [Arenibaculum pallidiluteum]